MAKTHPLTTIFNNALHIPLDRRFVLISDCHRGIGDWADDFAHNQLIYYHALCWYLWHDYTYIELGDGDELWENYNILDIYRAHANVFWVLREFLIDQRLFIIRGNHNWDIHPYMDTLRIVNNRQGKPEELFPHISIHDALVLDLLQYGKTTHILLTHGHQVDFMSNQLLPLSRLAVRYLWRPMQLLGVRDPTSPANSTTRRASTESKLVDWVIHNPHILITGHTHQPRFGYPHPRYFNTGSCVHPRCVTCIEIENNNISLVKWGYKVYEDGVVKVRKDVLEMPKPLGRL